MNRMQAQVLDFHEATGGFSGVDTEATRLLRAKLIMEEAVETVSALGLTVEAMIFDSPNKLELPVATFQKSYVAYHQLDYIDGLCDLIYVALGGSPVDLEPHFDEVHRANMAKLAGPKRADGKQLKPEGWTPPDHEAVLNRQKAREDEWAKTERELRALSL